MGDNTPQVGDRVRSKAVSHSDIGRITKIRSGAAQVLWPDGSRTWEQPEDLIFIGRDEPQQNYLTQGDGRLLSHFQTFNASTTGMAVEKPNWTKRCILSEQLCQTAIFSDGRTNPNSLK